MGFAVERFTEPPAEVYVCELCHQVLQDPRETTCEENHLFCLPCIQEWCSLHPAQSLSQTIDQIICPQTVFISSCPSCDKPIEFYKKPSRYFTVLYEKLELRCCYSILGCQEICEVGAIESHEKNCDFNPEGIVCCDSGSCRIRRREKEGHICLEYLQDIVDDLQFDVQEKRRLDESNVLLKQQIQALKRKNVVLLYICGALFFFLVLSSLTGSSLLDQGVHGTAKKSPRVLHFDGDSDQLNGPLNYRHCAGQFSTNPQHNRRSSSCTENFESGGKKTGRAGLKRQTAVEDLGEESCEGKNGMEDRDREEEGRRKEEKRIRKEQKRRMKEEKRILKEEKRRMKEEKKRKKEDKMGAQDKEDVLYEERNQERRQETPKETEQEEQGAVHESNDETDSNAAGFSASSTYRKTSTILDQAAQERWSNDQRREIVVDQAICSWVEENLAVEKTTVGGFRNRIRLLSEPLPENAIDKVRDKLEGASLPKKLVFKMLQKARSHFWFWTVFDNRNDILAELSVHLIPSTWDLAPNVKKEQLNLYAIFPCSEGNRRLSADIPSTGVIFLDQKDTLDGTLSGTEESPTVLVYRALWDVTWFLLSLI